VGQIENHFIQSRELCSTTYTKFLTPFITANHRSLS